MKRLLNAALVFMCLHLACSDSGTDSNQDPGTDPPIEFEMTVSCHTDDAHSTSQTIDTTGGSVSTTDANGVTYTLTVPPHSLSSSTAIALHPLDSFAVGGDAVVYCLDTAAGTVPPGVLCYPVDVAFDSGATLSMQMPVGFESSDDSTVTMICFDTAAGWLYTLATGYDSTTRTFSTTVYHFSGYSTVNAPPQSNDCELLQTAYTPFRDAAWGTGGTEYFDDMVARMYEVKASNYRPDPYWTGRGWIPCPSFNDRVDADMINLIEHHWEQIQDIYATLDVDNPQMGDLIDLYNQFMRIYSYGLGVAASTHEQTAIALKLFISDRLRAIGTHGYQLCLADDCDGRDYLQTAYGYGSDGWIVTSGGLVDNAYLQQLLQWIDDCCSEGLYSTVVVPGPTTIKRYAVDPAVVESNQYVYICSLEVHVERPGGTPAAGVPVRLFRNDESHHFTVFTTNDDGIAVFLFKGSETSIGVCDLQQVWTIKAQAYQSSNETWYDADNQVTITFLNQLATTAINYQYSYDWDSGAEPQLHWTASLVGSGTGPIREASYCVDACDGMLIRDYSGSQVSWISMEQEYQSKTWGTTANDSVFACRANIETNHIYLETVGRSFEFVMSASVLMGSSIFAGLIYTEDPGGVDTLQYGLSNTVWPGTALQFYAEEGGVLGDTTWTWSGEGVGEGSVVSVTYQVQVTIEE